MFILFQSGFTPMDEPTSLQQVLFIHYINGFLSFFSALTTEKDRIFGHVKIIGTCIIDNMPKRFYTDSETIVS